MKKPKRRPKSVRKPKDLVKRKRLEAEAFKIRDLASRVCAALGLKDDGATTSMLLERAILTINARYNR